MLRRVILAVVVAVAVTLGCIFLGRVLGTMNVAIAATVGGFIEQFAAAIGILAGLWHFFSRG